MDKTVPYITIRERQCIKLYAQDRTMHQVADELGITYNTVRTHMGNVTKRLNMSMPSIIYYLAKAGVI